MELPEDVREKKFDARISMWKRKRIKAKAITEAYMKLRGVKSMEEARKIYLGRVETARQNEIKRVEKEREKQLIEKGLMKPRKKRGRKKKNVENSQNTASTSGTSPPGSLVTPPQQE